MKHLKITIYFLAFLLIPLILPAEVVILKDGTQVVGRVEEQGQQVKVTTGGGVLFYDKKDIKVIYKNAPAVVKENQVLLDKAKKIIENANEIKDRKERNKALDKAIYLLREPKTMCMELLSVFTGSDGRLIGAQAADINRTIRHAKSLKVLESNLSKPKPKPVRPKVKPSVVESPEVEPALPTEDEVSEEGKKIAEEFYTLGRAFFDDKKYEKALKQFIKSLKYNNEYLPAMAKLGEIYDILGDEEQAWLNYKLCLEILDQQKELSGDLNALKSEVIRKSQKFAEFEKKLNQINQEFIKEMLKIGRACFKDEDYLLAEEIFKTILKIEPEDQLAREYLTEIQEAIEEE